jgi:formylglycine-generating enzyme required for sulfatase activity
MFLSIRKVSKIILFAVTALLAVFFSCPSGFAKEKEIKNSLGMAFVLIPAGSFNMGSPPGESRRNRDEVQHKVTISRPFYMQITEVTLKQWWAVMGKKFFGRRKGRENSPVVKVSWFDCIEFIEKLNQKNEGTYRLPTEAEWEYACRAGATSAYSWGDKIDCSKAMYSNNPKKSDECRGHVKGMGLKVGRPAAVKSYPPNRWGLYDMHGNVWEWCQDFYGAYPKTAVTDPKGPDEGKDRVRRGGSWFKHGWLCRSANRNMGHPASKYNTLGFRVVREVK